MIFKISNSDGRLRIAEIAALTDALGEAASQAYGRRTRRTVRFADGGEALEERHAYDKYGRLVAIAAFGTSVKWRYDARGRVARQVVDGSPIDFAYTKDGRLAGKWLGGRESPDASVEYEYSRDGRIAARTANGVRQAYEYDARGQLVAVKEGGADVERYAYDRAGNMVRKTVRGKTTAFTFDGANQLVSSTTDGVTTRYAYDAAGRLVREGAKTYHYGWLDKVLSVTDGARTYRYDWHADGQLARADYGDGTSESFLWDGLALVRRGGEDFVNEPHAGGGSPVASSKGAVYFNDLLGTTVGVREGRGPLRAKQGTKAPRYTAAALTAFGEPLPGQGAGVPASGAFFTGKPSVPGLGYAFLLRSYRPDLAKWQTADPFGYPDGWNRLAHCNNGVTDAVDWLGAVRVVCYDKNGRTQVPVVNAWELRESRREGLGAEAGHFGVDTIDISRDFNTGEWVFSLHLDLAVSASARPASSFHVGEVVEYRGHDGSVGDSYVSPPLYEAVSAHEWGHAYEFFNRFLPDLVSRLKSNFIDAIQGLAQAKEKFLKLYTLTDFEHLGLSGNYANARTRHWFETSPEWSLIRSNGLVQAWRKEE